jgi:hypothetical protein
MSDNDSNGPNSSNIANDVFKYYYENESGNVTYEDIDTCNKIIKEVAHSRGREISDHLNNNIYSELVNNLANIRASNFVITNSNLNSLGNNYTEMNRPRLENQSQSSQRQNILDNSHINSELNSRSNHHIHQNAAEIQIDDIFDQLTYAITTEKQNLRNDRQNLGKEKNKFSNHKITEMQKLQKEREIWLQSVKNDEESKVKETDIIDLDIGGTQKITTTRATLTKVVKYTNLSSLILH